MIYQGKSRYAVTRITLHTAALSDPASFFERFPNVEMMRDEVRRWHMEERGWRDIGYHGVFAPDGSFAEGRPIEEIGAHVKGQNAGNLGYCMFNVRPHNGISSFDDYFTRKQRRAVRRKIREIASLTEIQLVSGHNDFTDLKECPGFKVKSTDWITDSTIKNLWWRFAENKPHETMRRAA